MANFTESNEWTAGVRIVEPGDKVLGGLGSAVNLPFQALANRTLFNKNAIAAAVASINSLSAAKADKTVNMTAGAGLTGGGTLAASRTITLGTPGKNTASTTNSVGDATHTHEIDNASTSVAGIVMLVDALTSDSITAALSAAMGKKLAQEIAACLKTADLAAETAKLVTRRNYTRTITGTADSSKSMSVAGNVTVYPDGRIVQIIHVKDLSVIWFAFEAAAVGIVGTRHRTIPLQLWTAMPDAVTDVRPVFIRATNAAASQTYVNEAAEWICAWSLFDQGGSKTAVNIDASRFRGDSDEPIDLYVVIEGY